MLTFFGKFWLKPRGVLVDVLLVVLYLAVLFWAGLIPLTHLPGPEFKWADKVWHAVAFGGLAALGSRALRYAGRPAPAANRDAALVATALGGLLEVLQSFTAYRSADLADFVADALGVGLVYLVLVRLALAAEQAPPPRPAE